MSDNPYLESGPYDFQPVDATDEPSARKEAELLVEAIRHHDRQYYVLDAPTISDGGYD